MVVWSLVTLRDKTADVNFALIISMIEVLSHLCTGDLKAVHAYILACERSDANCHAKGRQDDSNTKIAEVIQQFSVLSNSSA